MQEIKRNLNYAFTLEKMSEKIMAYKQYIKCNLIITEELMKNESLKPDIAEKLLNLSLECMTRAKFLLLDRNHVSNRLSVTPHYDTPINERFNQEEDELVTQIHSNVQGTVESFKSSFGFLSKYDNLLNRVFSLWKTKDIDYFKFVMSIMLKGDIHEQINLSFKMFDLDRKGYVTRIEFLELCQNILEILHDLKLDIRMEWIKKMDQLLKTSDPKIISKQEFFTFFKNHLTDWIGLGIFQYSRKSGPSEALPITPGHPSFAKVLNMMLGIRYSLMTIPNLKYEIKFNELDFIDFYPNHFKQIRKISGISEGDYMTTFSIEQFLSNLLVGKWSTLSEKISDGKSGNFFYYSPNGLFMCKTISMDELETFKTILPDYLAYLESNPRSLLCRYFGLHQIQGNPFVVMGNVFSQRMEEIYDIKGSTFGRTNSTGKGILKDLDFDTNSRVLIMELEMYKQIERDVAFLEKFRIIDYSLLIGYAKNGLTEFGIIDHLIQYGFKKFGEHHFKTFILRENDISVTRPDLYAERFMKWIQWHLGMKQ
jgi:Ca2+-binding EF-hand superfamily protein